MAATAAPVAARSQAEPAVVSKAAARDSVVLDHSRPSMCAAFGDPHFITFDGGHTVFVGGRVFWLVKTEKVWIQGLSRDSEGKLMGVAIGGPFMKGNQLVLYNVGNLSLRAEFDSQHILVEDVDEFHVKRVVDAVKEEKWEVGLHNKDILKLRTEHPFNLGPFPNHFLRPPRGGVFLFHFDEGVEVTATGVDYMSVVVAMPRQSSGHAGYCGNYNGSPEDDAEPVVPSWNRPLGPGLDPVPRSESLFRDLPEGSVGTEAERSEEAAGTRHAGVIYARAHAGSRREEDADARRILLRRVLEFYSCPLHLRETALQRCNEVADARIREDCVFDVCTTGKINASEGAVAAEALQAEAVEVESLIGVIPARVS